MKNSYRFRILQNSYRVPYSKEGLIFVGSEFHRNQFIFIKIAKRINSKIIPAFQMGTNSSPSCLSLRLTKSLYK
jgi:hypothetical protein